MVNPSRFFVDPRIDKPWGSTLREKLPRSVRLRYINWGAKERQQWPTLCFWILHCRTWRGAIMKSQKVTEVASFQKEEKARSFLREAMINSLRRPLQVSL